MSQNKIAIAAGESQDERYAVIEARWSDAPLERFVIAYRDKGSLHKLLAAPSIIGIGFSSREAAVAAIANCSSTGAASKMRPRKASFRLFTETRSIVCATLQHAVAGCILLFYSRNALGAAIRSLVGASF